MNILTTPKNLKKLLADAGYPHGLKTNIIVGNDADGFC